MRGKKLILEATETGCIIPTSHKLNADGYFRKETAREYWLETGCTGLALCEKFGVSFSSACKWIREWKA